jgi:flagellar assembly factor FliW
MMAPAEPRMANARTDSRTIHSPWLGDVESNLQCELLFPCGLPGFEEHRRMVPVEIPAQRPLVYLQSLESPEVCFVALPVYVIDPAFQLHISEEDRYILQLPEEAEPAIGVDVLCLALLRKSGHSVEANLNASVLINLHNGRGVQCVPPAGISACFRLSADDGWRALC